MQVQRLRLIPGLACSAIFVGLLNTGCGGSSSNSGTDVPPQDTVPTDTASGLDTRPVNTTCLAFDKPAPGSGISLKPAFPNLSFVAPVAMIQAPGDPTSWYVAGQDGVVRVFDNDPATTNSSVFINIADRLYNSGESGLLGIAFHPDYQTNRQVFLSYTNLVGGNYVSYISRFTTYDNGATLDPTSEQIILELPQPYGNHNGGNIAFGPDRYLYIGLGDGGSAGDPQGNGQNTDTLLGAMLRIDPDGVSSQANYAIPGDNPFAQGGGAPEIYAWGFRNPWRWSFDRGTGELWVGDVGQDAWEEIDRVELGGNYGWNIMEGAHCYNAASCDQTGLIPPVVEYPHTEGCSVTGGFVYRGTQVPDLDGVYVYGDYCTGTIWGVAQSSPGTPTLLANSDLYISSFAEANNGELYVLDRATGTIHQFVSADGAQSQTNTIPPKLSETGCVDPTDPTQPAAGMVLYEINAPFWSDGAAKERWLALPEGATIHIEPNGDWTFPVGSVLMKRFSLGGQFIETRLLMRHDDGSWTGYSYEWNAAQTEATLVEGSKTTQISGQTWTYPSSGQCLECHTAAAGRSLGPTTAQLNRELAYPSTGRTANQLFTFEAIGLFDAPLPALPQNLPAAPDPADDTFDLHLRARSYLDTNCSQCHQPGGSTPANMDMRYDTADAEMNVCGAAPQAGDLGVANALIIAPGEPDRSLLLLRMERRDAQGMPPLASHLVDSDGVALIARWIAAMTSCP